MLGNYSCLSGGLLTFFQKVFFFSKNSFRVTNILDPDWFQHFVGHNLGPNLLQRLSVDIKSQLAMKNPIVVPLCESTIAGQRL